MPQQSAPLSTGGVLRQVHFYKTQLVDLAHLPPMAMLDRCGHCNVLCIAQEICTSDDARSRCCYALHGHGVRIAACPN